MYPPSSVDNPTLYDTPLLSSPSLYIFSDPPAFRQDVFLFFIFPNIDLMPNVKTRDKHKNSLMTESFFSVSKITNNRQATLLEAAPG